jgi:hypothetical protein
MGPDIEIPPSPDVTNRQFPGELEDVDLELEELRRGEIETALNDGGWRDGFEEWATYQDVDEASLDVAYEHDLFAEFDFYFDPTIKQVRAHPPALPEDWVDRTTGPQVAALRTALDDLGQIVAETLVIDYLDWSTDQSSDYVWREETFGTVEGEPQPDDDQDLA